MIHVRRCACALHETKLLFFFKRSKSQNGYINQLADTRNHFDFNNREHAKKLRGDRDVRLKIQMPSVYMESSKTIENTLNTREHTHWQYKNVRSRQTGNQCMQSWNYV
eukprot:607567_1